METGLKLSASHFANSTGSSGTDPEIRRSKFTVRHAHSLSYWIFSICGRKEKREDEAFDEQRVIFGSLLLESKRQQQKNEVGPSGNFSSASFPQTCEHIYQSCEWLLDSHSIKDVLQITAGRCHLAVGKATIFSTGESCDLLVWLWTPRWHWIDLQQRSEVIFPTRHFLSFQSFTLLVRDAMEVEFVRWRSFRIKCFRWTCAPFVRNSFHALVCSVEM
jgi:hypothetical protein